jgi:cobalamin biosynthesis protein CbiG
VAPGAGITRLSALDEAKTLAAVLVISDRCIQTLVPAQVVYRPPSLVVGVGCSSGASASDILQAVERALQQGQLAKSSLAVMATIDRRAEEPGLREAAEALEVPLKAYPAEVLAEVAGLPTPSEVVRASVGTPGVCEPAALLASGASTLLVPKVKTRCATAAIARISQETA